jgi:hypothetical protein
VGLALPARAEAAGARLDDAVGRVGEALELGGDLVLEALERRGAVLREQRGVLTDGLVEAVVGGADQAHGDSFSPNASTRLVLPLNRGDWPALPPIVNSMKS